MNQKSTEIERELKQIEKMREKQKLEIQGFIENEVKNKLIKRENEEKMLAKIKKEEEAKNENLRREKLRQLEKNKREGIINFNQLTEISENYKNLESQEFDDERRLYDRQIDEKIRKRDLIKKEEERQRQKEEYRLQNERNLEMQRLKAEERKKRLAQRV